MASPQAALSQLVEAVNALPTDAGSDAWSVPEAVLAATSASPQRGKEYVARFATWARGALQRLPPTHILVGGLDPLLDDSVDFNTRIRRMGVAGELRIYRSLPHTFVSFPHWHVLPEVQAALRQSIELLQAACWPHTAAAAEAAKAAAAHAQYGIGGTESEEEAKDVSMPMRPRAGSITRGRAL